MTSIHTHFWFQKTKMATEKMPNSSSDVVFIGWHTGEVSVGDNRNKLHLLGVIIFTKLASYFANNATFIFRN